MINDLRFKKITLGDKRYFLVLVLILFLLIPRVVFAQNQNNNQQIKSIFTISPIIIDTKLEKGKEQTFEIRIKNDLPSPLGIRANIENFINANGISSSRSKDIIDNSALSKTDLIIPEKEDQTVTLSIKTPQNLKDGGYYEMIFLTPVYNKPLSTSSPTILSRVAILFLGTIGETNYSDLKNKVSVNAEIKPIYEKNPINYSFTVNNSYFTHFSAKPFITITPIFGNAKRLELQDRNILPGDLKTWEEIVPKDNLSFFNKVNLAVSVGQGNYAYKDSFFFILPIKEILGLLAGSIIILILKLRGKQLKKALNILLKGN